MRAVVQRVSHSKVTVAGATVGEIGTGLMVLLGVGNDDTMEDCIYLVNKIINIRIFEDETGKLNISAFDRKLPVLVVSQFTLYGDCRQGRRPSFSGAAPSEQGKELYEAFCREIQKNGLIVAQGSFGAHMEVELTNDGPVTILLDSKRLF